MSRARYSWAGMKKIKLCEALVRFNSCEDVYLLYDDNTEAQAIEREDIVLHSEKGGEFGIEKVNRRKNIQDDKKSNKKVS